MKTKLTLIVFLLLVQEVISQSMVSLPLANKLTKTSTLNWQRIAPGEELRIEEYWTLLDSSVLLSRESKFPLASSIQDKSGWTHTKYHHTVNGILVEGSELILHHKDQLLLKANGDLTFGNFDLSPPILSPAEACQLAHQAVQAHIFAWQPGDTLPPFKLLYARNKYHRPSRSENFQLCYKINVNTISPHGGFHVYIDAHKGVHVKTIPFVISCVAGTGNTLYNGNQTLDMEDRGWPFNDFFLKDDCRGKFIQTFNRSGLTNKNVYSNSNNWANQHRPELSIHWAAQRTYDYFSQIHGRNSVDNQGRRLKLIYRQDKDFSPYNARWNTQKDKGYFGEADGILPLTSLDIVGHEISHGVIYHTADLEYAGESGALNESFADIFGTSVEHFAVNLFGPANTADWTLAEDIAGGAIRSMEDPGLFNHPSLFQGINWVPVSNNCNTYNDYCGVHTNSGVQNRWFQLLTEGGTVTDANIVNGQIRICGIGIEDAAKIAYRNLRFYLTRNAGHQDARNGAVQAAEDLYGVGSFQAQQCMNAWHAVGVGLPTTECSPVFRQENFGEADAISIQIFPNPITAQSKALIKNKTPQAIQIEIFSLQGYKIKTLSKAPKALPPGEHLFPIFVDGLTAGTYLLRFQTRTHAITRKVTIQ